MPTKNSRQNQTSPLPTCPICGSVLNFHNDRVEATKNGKEETIEVFLCIHHGFFHLRDTTPIKVGM